MNQELLLIQGSQPDWGLQHKASQLAEDAKLTMKAVSIAGLEKTTPDDSLLAKALMPYAANARIILAPATVRLRCIMPMLAWHLQAGLTADCTHLSISETGLLQQTRPAFGNSLMATIETIGQIQMATVRPGTFPPPETPGSMDLNLTSISGASLVRLIRQVAGKEEAPIGQAQIIVAGGAGIGSREGFSKLTVFARQIGGSVGASRNAVDAGYAPYSAQVGMTGTTVCPKLYIAVGISGAVQHLAGMSGSGTVIAINSDPKAPIFQYADFGIVGDWEPIIDQLMEEFV